MDMKFKVQQYLIGLCAILALSFVWGAATADPVALTFTRPVAYTNGSALPTTAITGYAVDCTFTPTGGTAAVCALTGSPLAGGTNQVGTVQLTYPAVGGEACFKLRTLVGQQTSAGTQPAVCRTLAALVPNDPTNLTITITVAVNISSDTPIRVAVVEPVVTRN